MKTRTQVITLSTVVAVVGLAGWFWRQNPTRISPQMDSPAAQPAEPVAREGSVTTQPAANPVQVTGAIAVQTATHAQGAVDQVFLSFSNWTGRYLAATPDERVRLLDEGIGLAKDRRLVLAQLIRTDPRAALAVAIPMTTRQNMPAEILAHLEQRVSGRGELSLLAATPVAGQQVDEPVFRSALVGDQEYRAYVYGQREGQSTLAATSLLGIALDGSLAVSESRVRVLEPGELLAGRPVIELCEVSGAATTMAPNAPLNLGTATAVEYNGMIRLLCTPDHVAQVEEKLLAGEDDHTDIAADNQPGASGVLGRPQQTWTHGTKKVLIIRVDFSDLPGEPMNGSTPITEDMAVNLFNNTNGVRDFFAQNSFNKTAVQVEPTVAGDSPDVTAVLRMPKTAEDYAVNNSNSALHADARAAALAANPSHTAANYDRIGVVFSRVSGISGSKITYGGLAQVTGKNFWISNNSYSVRVVSHELGHNYGLMHSNLWKVTDGDPLSPTGTSSEYGDIYDVMGNGSFQHHFNHWHKCLLRWIPDTAVTLAATPATHRIYRFDSVDADLTKPRALKIVRDGTRDFWIGYRRGTSTTSLNNGAYVLWTYNSNRQPELLDLTTPGNSLADAALAIGTSFTDVQTGIWIKPIAQGGSGSEEWLDVQVDFLGPMTAPSNAVIAITVE